MKKLFTVGITEAIQSAFPILLFVVLGVIYNDPVLSEGFIMTYPIQFLEMLLYGIFVKGQLKCEISRLENNHDRAISGLVLYFAIQVLFVAVMYFNLSYVLNILGFGIEYSAVFMFSTVNLSLDWILYGVSNIKQYDCNDSVAFRYVATWYTGKIVICFILGYVFRLEFETVATTLYLVYATVALCLTINNAKGLRFKFSVKEGIRFSMVGIPSNICMFLIYAYGVSFMQNSSTVMLAAYNMMTMCTDVQWDILNTSIDTVTNLRIKSGEYLSKERAVIVESFLYGLTLLASSMLCLLLMYAIPVYRDSIDFSVALVLLIIECCLMPVDGVKYAMRSYLQTEHPTVTLFFMSLSIQIVRLVFTVRITSEYRVAIATLIEILFGTVIVYSYYIYIRYKLNIKHSKI